MWLHEQCIFGVILCWMKRLCLDISSCTTDCCYKNDAQSFHSFHCLSIKIWCLLQQNFRFCNTIPQTTGQHRQLLGNKNYGNPNSQYWPNTTEGEMTLRWVCWISRTPSPLVECLLTICGYCFAVAVIIDIVCLCFSYPHYSGRNFTMWMWFLFLEEKKLCQWHIPCLHVFKRRESTWIKML